MITTGQIYLAEISIDVYLLQQRDHMGIFHCKPIQCPVVNAQPPLPEFFSTISTGAPKGEVEGLMYSFASESSSWRFRSCSSD
jgi:hypothetical protein